MLRGKLVCVKKEESYLHSALRIHYSEFLMNLNQGISCNLSLKLLRFRIAVCRLAVEC